MKKLIFALIASAAAMGAAQAQTAGPYIGLGVATTDHDFKIGGATNMDADGYKPSAKIFGGYKLDDMWAVEAGYTDLRKANANYSIGGIASNIEADGKRFYLAGKLTRPLSDVFSVYGKLGAGYSKAEWTTTTGSTRFDSDESDTELYGALGAEYNLSKQVALSLEYERYGKSKDFGAKADTWTVAAKYSF